MGGNLLGVRAPSDGRHRGRAAVLIGAIDGTLTGAGLLGRRSALGRCLGWNPSSLSAAGLAVTGGSLIPCLMGLGGRPGRGFSIPARAIDATVAGTRRIDLGAVSDRSLGRSAMAAILGIARRGFGGRHPARHGLDHVLDPGRTRRSASGVG